MKEANKSGTSSVAVLKTERALKQYEFMQWMDLFVQRREGRNNLPAKESEQPDDVEVQNEIDINGDTNTFNESGESIEEQPGNNEEALRPCASSKSGAVKIGKNETSKNRKNSLLHDMEYSLINQLNERIERREKRKAESTKVAENNSEEVFCKALALDLKELPIYERCMAKHELRSVLLKYQMAAISKKLPSSPQIQQLPNLMQQETSSQDFSKATVENNFLPNGYSDNGSNFSSPPYTPCHTVGINRKYYCSTKTYINACNILYSLN